MKLSVSNIAWAPEEVDDAYRLLAGRGVPGLEIAPALFLPDVEDPFAATSEDCAAALERASAHGLSLTSMQSLLFGVDGAALFGTEAERQRLSGAMDRVIALAGRLGVPNLVFGSPKNRVVPDEMSAEDARAIWQDAFRRMGSAALSAGTIIALEPNPEGYGTNFMTTLAETAEVARTVDHPAVRVNLDLGALIMTGEIERVEAMLPEVLPLVSHVHLSTPYLEPLGSRPQEVGRLAAALRAAGWGGWVSIEMRRGLDALPEAIDVAMDALEAAR